MKENLSALIDDELYGDDLGPHLSRLKEDVELRRAWDTYHLIGDALRGHISTDFSGRVAARLAQEPVVLAPRPPVIGRGQLVRYAMSAAAGVGAVALVAWTALPLMRPDAQLAANAPAAVAAAAPATVAAAAPAAVPPTALAAEMEPRLAAKEIENYLLAHQPYSQSSAMQGPAPYVRSVTDERGNSVK